MIALLKRWCTRSHFEASVTPGRRVYTLYWARFGVADWPFERLSPRMRSQWEALAEELREELSERQP